MRRDACHDDRLVNRDGLRAFVDACQVLVGQVDTNADESTRMLRDLLIRVLRRIQPSAPHAARSMNFRVTRALDYLEERFSNTALDLASAARYVDVTPSHLDRLLKEHTGLTFLGHLRRIRMRHAEQLLLARSVKETSYLCGYNAVCSFGRDFKRTFGCPPRVWRDLVCELREPIS